MALLLLGPVPLREGPLHEQGRRQEGVWNFLKNFMHLVMKSLEKPHMSNGSLASCSSSMPSSGCSDLIWSLAPSHFPVYLNFGGNISCVGWSNLFPHPEYISDATCGMFIGLILFIVPTSKKLKGTCGPDDDSISVLR